MSTSMSDAVQSELGLKIPIHVQTAEEGRGNARLTQEQRDELTALAIMIFAFADGAPGTPAEFEAVTNWPHGMSVRMRFSRPGDTRTVQICQA